MARFAYKAVDGSGQVISGEHEAQSQTASIDLLIAAGHTPITSEEVGSKPTPWWQMEIGPGKKLSSKELVFLTQQLGSLVNAGLPLARALEILSSSALRPFAQELTQKLLERIQGGETLSRAMAAEPHIFPKHYTSLIAAGEESGALDQMLTRLGEYLEQADTLRSRITSALIYPCILLLMIVGTLVAVVGFVLPQFQPLFEDAGAELPFATQVVMGIGGFIETYGFSVAGVFAGLAALFVWALRQPKFRLAFDTYILSARWTLDLPRKSETANFAHTLGTLLENGLPMPKALEATKETLKNTAMKRAVAAAGEAIRAGRSLSVPLKSAGVFPDLCVQLVTVGEETGDLSSMLKKLSAIYEREVQNTLDRALALLVPILTIVMGGIVALLIGSILIGILSINQLAI